MVVIEVVILASLVVFVGRSGSRGRSFSLAVVVFVGVAVRILYRGDFRLPPPSGLTKGRVGGVASWAGGARELIGGGGGPAYLALFCSGLNASLSEGPGFVCG